MPTFRELVEQVLADGSVDAAEVKALEEAVFADGEVSREEAEGVLEILDRAEQVAPEFEGFALRAVKRHVLADGVVDAEEAAWLRGAVFADGEVSEWEKQLLRELKAEATRTCPEFEALFQECVG